MRLILIIFTTILLLSGCNLDTAEDTIEFITELSCEQVVDYNSDVACVEAPPDALLLQSVDNRPLTIKTEALTITFDSTIYWSVIPGQQIIIATIDGVNMVSSEKITRVITVPAGAQLTFPLEDDDFDSSSLPSAVHVYDMETITSAPLGELPRMVQQPAPFATSTPPSAPTPEPTPEEVGCLPRADWPYNYTVRPGDNLTAIANLHLTTADELQTGNCLENPNRIQPGDILRVPNPSAWTTPVGQ
jgi:LysM repeat protein